MTGPIGPRDDESLPGWAAPVPPAPPLAPPPNPSGPWAGATAPPRRGRAWLVVLLSILGGIALVAAGGTVLFVDRTLPPLSEADRFLDDLTDLRLGRAAARLCRADRDDPDGALDAVFTTFIGAREIGVDPFGVDRDGAAATVEYTVEGRGTDRRTYALAMREEHGTWRACPGTDPGALRRWSDS